MYFTLSLIIGLTTLGFLVLLNILGLSIGLLELIIIVALFNLVQWLIAPYIIEALYGVREADPIRYSWLHEIVKKLSRKSGIKKPKVMIADIPIPNAFAYGSPLTGNRIAITKGLLTTLRKDEIEAVIGHELGHIVHKDVVIMMLISLIPAILYYLGYSLMYVPSYEDEDEEGGTNLAIVGIFLLLFSYVLNLFILGLSRLREYYADRHSASIVEYGARKLQLALAKIVFATNRIVRSGYVNIGKYKCFKALFISDPSKATSEAQAISYYRTLYRRGDYALVESLKRKKVTVLDVIDELFSTHPNIVKRLKALDQVAAELGQV